MWIIYKRLILCGGDDAALCQITLTIRGPVVVATVYRYNAERVHQSEQPLRNSNTTTVCCSLNYLDNVRLTYGFTCHELRDYEKMI